MTGCKVPGSCWACQDRAPGSGNIWGKDRGRKVSACSGSLVLRRQEGKDANRKTGTWKPASPVPVSPGANSANTLSLERPCPQAPPAPSLRVETPPRCPVLFSGFLECAGPPLRPALQLLCSAERVHKHVRHRQGRFWRDTPTHNTTAGQELALRGRGWENHHAGWGQDGLQSPPPSSSAPSSAVTHKFTKMKSLPSRGCKKSAA